MNYTLYMSDEKETELSNTEIIVSDRDMPVLIDEFALKGSVRMIKAYGAGMSALEKMEKSLDEDNVVNYAKALKTLSEVARNIKTIAVTKKKETDVMADLLKQILVNNSVKTKRAK